MSSPSGPSPIAPLPQSDDLTAQLTAARAGIPKVTIILGVAVLVVVSFIGGVFVQKSFGSTSNTAASSQQRRPGGTGNGQGGFGGGGFGRGGQGGGTAGTIDHVDGSTVYLKMPDGSTVTVTTSDSTQVQETIQGKVADLKAGQTIIVQGAKAADGSYTANRITERPAAGN